MPPRHASVPSTSTAPVPAILHDGGDRPHNAIERDIDAMLRKSQPGNFSGEGKDVGKILEDWIERMDDYFDLA